MQWINNIPTIIWLFIVEYLFRANIHYVNVLQIEYDEYLRSYFLSWGSDGPLRSRHSLQKTPKHRVTFNQFM